MGQSSKTKHYLYQYIAAIAAACGALSAGFCLGWTSTTADQILNGHAYDFKINEDQFAWVGSFLNVGAAFISIPIGFLINVIGRKYSMLLLVFPFILGWALLIWAQNIEMMWIARLILGLSAGGYFVIVPLYTAEIASKEIRGMLCSFFQLMIVFGILLSYVLGWILKVFTMSLICAAVPILFGVIFAFMPESPAFLVSVGKIGNAKKSIQCLRGKEYDYTQELNNLQIERDEIAMKKVGFLRALSKPVAKRALCIIMGLTAFQQLSGINAVIFYTESIFLNARVNIDSHLAAVLVGIIQFIATIVSMLVVDRLGRRFCLLFSGIGMTVCTTAMGIYFYMQSNNENSVDGIRWLPVISLCIFVMVFSFGFGPVPWIMLGELFSIEIKAIAGLVAGTFHWVFAFLITKTFVNLTIALGKGQTFWLFAGFTIVGCIFVTFFVPETKGKSLAEIQRILGAKSTEAESSIKKEVNEKLTKK